MQRAILFRQNNLEVGVDSFDYNAPAELYPGRNRKSAKKFSYRRFETAADAIRSQSRNCPKRCYSARASRLTNGVSATRTFKHSTRASNIHSKKGVLREYKEASSRDERTD